MNLQRFFVAASGAACRGPALVFAWKVVREGAGAGARATDLRALVRRDVPDVSTDSQSVVSAAYMSWVNFFHIFFSMTSFLASLI